MTHARNRIAGGANIIIHAAGVCGDLLECGLDVIRADRLRIVAGSLQRGVTGRR
jgi:trimethylamine:corrinoid methyltransferase-like protein